MAKKKFNLLVPSTFPSNVTREMQRRFLMDGKYISALGLSTPFFVSRRRDETVDREIYCSDCVSGRRRGGGEESWFSMLGGGGEGAYNKDARQLDTRWRRKKKCFDANVRACVVVVAYSPFILGENWVLFRVPSPPPFALINSSVSWFTVNRISAVPSRCSTKKMEKLRLF